MSTGSRSAGRRVVTALGAVLSLTVLAGCVADPPPPTVVGEERDDSEPVDLSADGVLLTLDRVEEGFNPHLLADRGVDTDLVASLLLPSAFVDGPDGRPQLNRTLLVSAGPLPGAPETIRYTLHPRAQWSDGVPVAAEDFEYLWRQMTTQPGVVDPAGYEQIADVRAGAGGKVVDVVFDSPPDNWRSLFSDLLPGHILKDAPDGFQGAMDRLPVMSAGPFMIRAADIGRGEIELVPNDRYWAENPGPAQIVVRRASGAGQLGTALRDGPGVLSLVSATPVATDVATTVPGVLSETVADSSQLELTFNTVAPAVRDRQVRRALAAAVDPAVIGRIVTGEASPATTSFPFPETSGTTPTSDPAQVARALGAAGFSRESDGWERDGIPLSVTLGVDATDERALTAAFTAADQLHAAGIGARVWEMGPVALYADALPHGLVDAVVGWQQAQGDAGLAAVSRFSCAGEPGPGDRSDDQTPAPGTAPSRPRTTVPTLTLPEPARDTRTGPTSSEATTTTTPTTPPRTLGRDAPARGADLSGVCDEDLERALGTENAASGPELARAGELVAGLALRVPLVRPTLLLSAAGVESGQTGAEQPESDATPDARRTVPDVFDTAPTWRSTG